MNPTKLKTQIMMSWLGKPYRWGGDDPIYGPDCSGLIIEAKKSVGELPREGDWTANSLFEMACQKALEVEMCDYDELKYLVEEGCEAYWWNHDCSKIVHVEYCLEPLYPPNAETIPICIGASGGGSKTSISQELFNDLISHFNKHFPGQANTPFDLAELIVNEHAKYLAAQQNAYVKIRPLFSRKNIAGIHNPATNRTYKVKYDINE